MLLIIAAVFRSLGDTLSFGGYDLWALPDTGFLLFLLVFNLLPAYPLDGGRTLEAWLRAVLSPLWSTRIVAGLGLIVAIGVGILALPNAFFLMLVALFLAMANWQAWQSVGGWR